MMTALGGLWDTVSWWFNQCLNHHDSVTEDVRKPKGACVLLKSTAKYLNTMILPSCCVFSSPVLWLRQGWLCEAEYKTLSRASRSCVRPSAKESYSLGDTRRKCPTFGRLHLSRGLHECFWTEPNHFLGSKFLPSETYVFPARFVPSLLKLMGLDKKENKNGTFQCLSEASFRPAAGLDRGHFSRRAQPRPWKATQDRLPKHLLN